MKVIQISLAALLLFGAIPAQSMQKETAQAIATNAHEAAFKHIKNNAYRLGTLVLEMSKKTLASKTKEINEWQTEEKFAAVAKALPHSLLKLKTALATFCRAVDTYGKTPFGPQYMPDYMQALKNVTASLRALKDTFERIEKTQQLSHAVAQAAQQRIAPVATPAPAALPAMPIAGAADQAPSISVQKDSHTTIDKKHKKALISIGTKKALAVTTALAAPLAIAGTMAAYNAGYLNPAALAVVSNAVTSSARALVRPFASAWNSIRGFGSSTADAVTAATPAPAAASDVATQIINTGAAATTAVMPSAATAMRDAAIQAANTGVANAFNSFDIFTNHAK